MQMEKRRTRKVFKKAITAALPVILLTASACSSEGDGKSAASEESGKPAATKIVSISGQITYPRNTDVERRVHEIIKEKTGVDVEMIYLPGNQVTNKRNLMLSSGEQLDFFATSLDSAIQLYKSGAIIGINELLDQYGPNLKKNVNPKAFREVTYEGNILGIPSDSLVITPNLLEIRTDWLKKLDLPMPVTIADFENVMDAFQNQDPDGNGINDTFALSTGWGALDKLELAFAPAFLPQAMEWWQDGQGRLQPPELHPAYKDMMGKFVEWNKKGYIWPDVLLSTMKKQGEAIAENKIGAVAGWFSSTIVNALELLVKHIPEADYEPVLLQGKGINKLATTAYQSGVVVITKKSKHQDAVMRFLDYHATKEGYYMTFIGPEGENYTRLPDGSREYIADDKEDNSKAKYYAKYYMFGLNWPDEPSWPISSWVYRKYNEMKAKAERLPRFDAIDKNVFYDKSQWKSNSKLSDMAAYLNEQKMKVFAGETPLSEWDAIMQKWKDIGGAQMIDDRNDQFHAARK